MGPRACSFCVEIPTSAPRPSSPPSVNRVEAFTITAAESTSAMKRSALARSLVTMASVCPVDQGGRWLAAAGAAVPAAEEGWPPEYVDLDLAGAMVESLDDRVQRPRPRCTGHAGAVHHGHGKIQVHVFGGPVLLGGGHRFDR